MLPSVRSPRIVSCLALLAVVASGIAQTPWRRAWEKLIRPGLTYRMEWDTRTPRLLHALRWSPGGGVKARSELADRSVYSADGTKGRQTVSSLVRLTGALAGINGDYFPYTGDPLGAMVRDGELLSRPYPKRPAFGWGDKDAKSAILTWRAAIESPAVGTLKLWGLNEECPDDGVVLNTPAAGLALAKKPSVYALIKTEDAVWGPTTVVEGTFQYFFSDMDSLPVQKGTVILAARGESAKRLVKLKPGDPVKIEMTTTGMDWSSIDNVMGGGPYLVRNGVISVDWQAAGFKSSFANNRHPRTAVGRTAAGDVWWVTVDGRSGISPGATLGEMARIMKRLGCVEAINLDGGGSTTLSVAGRSMNRPSDGGERAVANAVLFFAAAAESSDEMAIAGPSTVDLANAGAYQVVGPDGKAIPTSEVLWQIEGQAWVDQGGSVRGISEGPATIVAVVRGRRLTLPIRFERILSKTGSGGTK